MKEMALPNLIEPKFSARLFLGFKVFLATQKEENILRPCFLVEVFLVYVILAYPGLEKPHFLFETEIQEAPPLKLN